MALFSRRDVQRALDRLARTLGAENALPGIIGRLEGDPAPSLAAQWEVAWLAALAQTGRLEIEADHGGTARPDIFYRHGSGGRLEFAAEIATVSDRSAHEANPYGVLWSEVRRYARSRGCSGRGLDLRVESENTRKNGGSQVRLKLPPRADLARFVREKFCALFDRIRQNPNRGDSAAIDDEGVEVTLRYHPEWQHAGGGHAVYTIPTSPRRNPLGKALRSKADQLSDAGYEGMRGIIVCDGGCEALRHHPPMHGHIGCGETVQRFFHDRRSVQFVLLVRVVEGRGHRPVPVLEPELFWHPHAASTLRRDLWQCLSDAVALLPKPELTPANALSRLAQPGPRLGESNYGAFMTSRDVIRLPARAVLELLAGTLPQTEFLRDHALRSGRREGEPGFPLVLEKLQSGRLLRRVYLERCEHEDDDWIVLEFGEPDAAIAPFRAPASESE